MSSLHKSAAVGQWCTELFCLVALCQTQESSLRLFPSCYLPDRIRATPLFLTIGRLWTINNVRPVEVFRAIVQCGVFFCNCGSPRGLLRHVQTVLLGPLVQELHQRARVVRAPSNALGRRCPRSGSATFPCVGDTVMRSPAFQVQCAPTWFESRTQPSPCGKARRYVARAALTSGDVS